MREQKKKKSNIRLYILFTVVFLILYIFIFPGETDREVFLRPFKAVALSPEEVNSRISAEAPASAFEIGGKFGYITPEMDLMYLDTSMYGLALTSYGFINYSKIPEFLVVQDKRGEMVSTITTKDYPFQKNDKLFLISPDRTRLTRWDHEKQRKIWEQQFGMVLTSFDVGENLTLVGCVDGAIKVFNPQGEDIFQYEDKRSRIPVVLGLALSESEEIFAAIMGRGPQYISVFRKKEDTYVQSYTIDLTEDFTRRPFMRFSEDEKSLFFEGQDEEGHTRLKMLSLKDKKIETLPFKGEIIAFSPQAIEGLYPIIIKSDQGMRFIMFSKNREIYIDTEFSGSQIFFKHIEDTFYLGIDDTIVRLDWKEG